MRNVMADSPIAQVISPRQFTTQEFHDARSFDFTFR
jgi:hypothetical protein